MNDAIPQHYNFAHDVIERQGQERPDALALWWVGEQGAGERKLSFGELSGELRRAAAFFAAQGVRRGDCVLVILNRVPEWWVAVLGLIRLGAVPIPGTPLLTPKDIAYRIQAASVRAIITDAAGAAKVGAFDGLRFLAGGAQAGWTDFDAGVRTAQANPPYEPSRSSDPGIIYFTSGTTGEAKMVLHTQVSYGIGHRITGGDWLDLGERDLIWALADTGWAKTAWSNFFGPWLMGAAVFTLDMRGKFDPTVVLQTLAAYPITVFCCPATALRLLVRKDLKAFKFPHLRHCVSAGEALNPPVFKTWREATGLDIYEGYGQTESVLMVGNFRRAGREIRPGSMGHAAPGYDLAVVDEDGVELPAGAVGQLAIRVQPQRPLALFQEYWRNPEENAARFVGPWYLTGDTVKKDDAGYFWFVGRADDVINSASYRIGPGEVESALLEHPAVLECAAIGVPEEMRGEIVKAFVVPREGYTPDEPLKHELQTHCKTVTAPYKYPRLIEFVPALPKTVSGKIRRTELRARERAHPTLLHPHA
ncbi:MAG: AMP-binding protein [Kiritimatiellaeota bacterium]|nr:AMP-binding protein [Kiritimatiellota bacterium]